MGVGSWTQSHEISKDSGAHNYPKKPGDSEGGRYECKKGEKMWVGR